jgi:ribosomal protein S18 acetylase RimI-like enzyme
MNMERQIAELLNTHNQLDKKYDEKGIRRGEARYLFIHKDGEVWGAVGIQRIRYLYTIIKHLTVKPEYRRKGMALALMEMALNNTNTPFVLSTVREDNIPSISLLEKLGFKKAGSYLKNGYLVYLLVKSMDNIKVQKEL